MENSKTPNYSDHDLLIRVDTMLDALTREVREARNTTKEDIVQLRIQKLNTEEFHDFLKNNDMRNIEAVQQREAQSIQISGLLRFMYIAIGVLGTIEFAAPLLLKHFNVI